MTPSLLTLERMKPYRAQRWGVGEVRPLTLIHKREKICPESGTQRTDLRSRLRRDFLGAEQKAFYLQNLLRQRREGIQEKECG